MFFTQKIHAVMAIIITTSIFSQELQARSLSPRLIEADHAEAIYRHLVEVHWTE